MPGNGPDSVIANALDTVIQPLDAEHREADAIDHRVHLGECDQELADGVQHHGAGGVPPSWVVTALTAVVLAAIASTSGWKSCGGVTVPAAAVRALTAAVLAV